MHSPIHFTVRLLEHQQANQTKWRTINKSNNYIGFSLKFTVECTDKSKLEPIQTNAKGGDYCVVFVDDQPQRGQIIKRYEKG